MTLQNALLCLSSMTITFFGAHRHLTTISGHVLTPNLKHDLSNKNQTPREYIFFEATPHKYCQEKLGGLSLLKIPLKPIKIHSNRLTQ